jgi:hypothetical protein
VVSELRTEDRSVQVALKGKNAMGNHVSGTVRVRLP